MSDETKKPGYTVLETHDGHHIAVPNGKPEGSAGSGGHVTLETHDGHHIAMPGDWLGQLHQEGKMEEAANVGYVWTIDMGGTATIKAGAMGLNLAKCDYTLELNCSHVGPTVFGVYRGTLGMKFHGDITGTKIMLAALGFSSSQDIDGWFRNDNFVMKIKPYRAEDEQEFIDTFDTTDEEREANRPKPTGDAQKDAAAQAAYDSVNNLVDSLVNGIGSAQQTAEKAKVALKKPSGLWYDWDFHMTSGDMGMFLKLNGGPLFVKGHANATVDASGHQTQGEAVMHSPFGTYRERYDEPIDSPFPYTVRVYPDGSVLFTLYNAKGGPVRVCWAGGISRIPVSQTTVVK